MIVRLLILFSLVFCHAYANALETVTLQLKWKHQFQFAGYYAALAKGYYKEAGLNVVIKEAGVGQDPIDAVVKGQANYGVGTSELMLRHAAGQPVVVLGVIFQHSPLALAVKRSDDNQYLHDLVNKPLMIEPNSAELFAYFAREGIEKQKLDIVHHSFDIQDLVSHRVEGMSVYVTDEPFSLERAGVDVSIFKPSVSGIDFYGDNLFTTQDELKKNPERVKAFREASFKGWQYAMSHQDEMISLIYNLYTKRHSIEHLRFEAEEMKRLLQPSLVEIGYMHEGRWRHIARTYAQQGFLPENYDLSGFLYAQEKGVERSHYIQSLMLAVLTIIIVLFVLAYVWRLNSSLKASQNRLSSIIDNTPIALLVINKKGEISRWNNQAKSTFGWSQEEALGQNIYDLIIPEDQKESVEIAMEDILEGDTVSYSENWNVTKAGDRILCNWSNISPDEETVVCMASNITAQKKMEARLKELAHTDPLTQVANRALFFEKVQQAILLAKRRNEKLALLYIDLDKFKNINDRHGHTIGDKTLCQVVQRIQETVREADLLARIGGDEFVLMLYNSDAMSCAKQVAEKIEVAMTEDFLVDGLSLKVGCTIGISFYPEDGLQVSELLNKADQEMYTIKRKKKYGLMDLNLE